MELFIGNEKTIKKIVNSAYERNIKVIIIIKIIKIY
jgi:hypothetical protein